MLEFEKSKFKWDPEKNKENIKKHGVSFEEARDVFYDDNALYLDDTNHSYGEERFLVVGFSKIYKLLTVCHCYRENDAVIRIISARKATFYEKILYGEELQHE